MKKYFKRFFYGLGGFIRNIRIFLHKIDVDKRVDLAVKLIDKDETLDFESEYKEVKELWKKFFFSSFKAFGMNNKSIQVLWDDFDMSNWGAMHIENTEYRNHTRAELFNDFIWEVHYICDRISIDRVFRTHWLYRQAFDTQISIEQWGGDKCLIKDGIIKRNVDRDVEILINRSKDELENKE